jgi:hypothetical protein
MPGGLMTLFLIGDSKVLSNYERIIFSIQDEVKKIVYLTDKDGELNPLPDIDYIRFETDFSLNPEEQNVLKNRKYSDFKIYIPEDLFTPVMLGYSQNLEKTLAVQSEKDLDHLMNKKAEWMPGCNQNLITYWKIKAFQNPDICRHLKGGFLYFDHDVIIKTKLSKIIDRNETTFWGFDEMGSFWFSEMMRGFVNTYVQHQINTGFFYISEKDFEGFTKSLHDMYTHFFNLYKSKKMYPLENEEDIFSAVVSKNGYTVKINTAETVNVNPLYYLTYNLPELVNITKVIHFYLVKPEDIMRLFENPFWKEYIYERRNRLSVYSNLCYVYENPEEFSL